MKRIIGMSLFVMTLFTVFVFATVYEDAENRNIDGWSIYDNSPEGASISNIEESGNRVIQLEGAGTENGYMLGDWSGGDNAWNNTTKKTITWRMKYDEDFIVYINVETKKGQRYLYYTNKNGSSIWKNYMHHGLGSSASDGIWKIFTRDLEKDLKDLEPSNSIIAVNAFLIRGSGLIDDIELFNRSNIISSFNIDKAHGIVLSSDEKLAFVATYNHTIEVIDISNPRSPKVLDSFSTFGIPFYITRVSQHEMLIYSLSGSFTYQLSTVDISDPLNLTTIDVHDVSQRDALSKYSMNNIVLSQKNSLGYVIHADRLLIVRLD